jgi:hypothetical protein
MPRGGAGAVGRGARLVAEGESDKVVEPGGSGRFGGQARAGGARGRGVDRRGRDRRQGAVAPLLEQGGELGQRRLDAAVQDGDEGGEQDGEDGEDGAGEGGGEGRGFGLRQADTGRTEFGRGAARGRQGAAVRGHAWVAWGEASMWVIVS